MDQMYCVITIRKGVVDAVEARRLYDLVKNFTAQVPDIVVAGHATTHFSLEEPQT